MRSISCHITPLVVTSFGRGHTHTHTHADDPHRINFKKPGAGDVGGLKISAVQVYNICTRIDLKAVIFQHFLGACPQIPYKGMLCISLVQ